VEVFVHAKVLQAVLLGLTLGAVSCANGDASIVPDATGGAGPTNATGGAAATEQGSGGFVATGGNRVSSGGTETVATGGAANAGGATTSLGGASETSAGATGGVDTTGNTGSGGVATGGKQSSDTASGGDSSSGGESAGGAGATGGAESGGESATGGTSAYTGGTAATGGTSAYTGGTAATGGVASGGAATSATGGLSSGGTASSGGAATGGTSATSPADPCTVTTPLTGGKTYCAASSGSVGNSYEYELSLATVVPTAQTCATVYGKDAAFKSNWSATGAIDFTAAVGLAFDSTKTYLELGTLSSDFALTKTGAGACTVGIHLATASPSLEYFIIEDWNGARPTHTVKYGPITVDGGQYDVYQHIVYGTGMASVTQYMSVRSTPRHCGHISVTEHLKEWAKLGLTTGKLSDCKLMVESTGGNGTVDFTWATVQVQ